MNTRSAIASALLLSLAAMPIAPAVNASANGIQRCQAPDGTTVYTDKPCGMFGAQVTPMSGELLTRLAREEAANPATVDLYQDAQGVATSGLAPVGRRSASSGCARSATQLSMDLQGALALADVNRVAESYHWTGLSNTQGREIMERLDRMTRQPLVHAEYFNAQIGGGLGGFADASAPANMSANAGIMQLSFGQGASRSVIDFDVHRYQGCYFVRF